MNPYKSMPNRQFWSRSVSKNYDASLLAVTPTPYINKEDKIVSAGSCFAANLVPYLEKSGFQYIKRDSTNFLDAHIGPEAMSYGKFSAAYGNIYTTRQLKQLLERALKLYNPIEDRWICGDAVVDPFRPGLRYSARSNYEFDLLQKQHLESVLSAFRECTVFIFTLGLTEAWVSKLDGAVFPVCPGTVSGEFNPTKYEFVNFSVDQVVQDFIDFHALFKTIHDGFRLILTVSPVPLVATASNTHVLCANTYSKSVLRVAAERICSEIDTCCYFPAYEIVTGPQAPASFYDDDRRSVSREGIEAVMSSFLRQCKANYWEFLNRDTNDTSDDGFRISREIVDAECEEAFLDDGRNLA